MIQITKKEQIYKLLKERIEGRAYVPGSRLPKEVELSAELGVSPQTVNYHISQALRTLGVALKDYLPLLLWLLSLSGRNDLV